jgi:hypothetical protein
MARRPDQREAEMLSEENLRDLRHNLAHLSLPAVRDFYEQAYRDCRLIYNELPSPADPGSGVEAVVEVALILLVCRKAHYVNAARSGRTIFTPFL